MSYYSLYCGLCLVLVLSVKSNQGFTVKEDHFQLSLVHFNDFHARFEETSRTSTKCIQEKDCIGGFARLYTAINQLKAERPDSVVLNAGDTFQGTLWYNLLRWNVTQYFMNMLPLDAHTLGNHEFDNGVPGAVPYIKALKAPMVVANIDDSQEPSIQGIYKDSIIIQRSNKKIGIVGVISSLTHELSSTGKLKFLDEVQVVRRVADKLAAEGVDIIIVLSHCGIETDRVIAAEAGSNIDIIVGGHSHSLLYPKGQTPPSGEVAVDDYPVVVQQSSGNTVLIVQASAFTKYLGDLRVDFDSQGRVMHWEGKPIYLDSSIKQDEKILNLLKPLKEQVDSLGKRQIGYAKVKLDMKPCQTRECNIGNFITDALMDFLVNISEPGQWAYAGACFINQGAIRTNIEKGVITYEDLVIAQPFGDYLETFDIKGKHLLESFEYAAGKSDSKEVFMAQHVLQVSGFKLVYNITNPPGERLLEAKIRCAKCDIPSFTPIEPETVYRVGTSTFVANGGDGFTMISKNKVNVKSWDVEIDILENYLIRRSPVISGIEGRIIVRK